MNHFDYKDGELFAENISLRTIADQVGTPCYVYSRSAIEQQWHSLNDAFGQHPHTICYAVKANSNLAVLNILSRLGSGFDIVSEGELRRVILAGGDTSKVVYSGVAKSQKELEFAIKAKVRSINIESIAELERVQEVANELKMTAPISVRVNPDVDPQTHPYISTGMEEAKFGIDMESAFETYQAADNMENIHISGIACHIGSQITSASPFKDSVDRVLGLVNRLSQAGVNIEHLDLGGGLGIDYQGETPPTAQEYVSTLLDCLNQHEVDLPISIEPGRYIVGNAGVLVTKVEYLKSNSKKNFAIVDAGMNDLLRPSLYQAFHQIDTVQDNDSAHESKKYDVVGPVCESADVLGYDRELSVEADDLLAVRSAGAYSFVMASNYNSRPKPVEVMVDGDEMHIIRRRETMEELTQAEAILP